MLPTGETISPRSKFPHEPLSINQLCQPSLGWFIECHIRTAREPEGFFYEIIVRLTPSLTMLTQSAMPFSLNTHAELSDPVA